MPLGQGNSGVTVITRTCSVVGVVGVGIGPGVGVSSGRVAGKSSLRLGKHGFNPFKTSLGASRRFNTTADSRKCGVHWLLFR